MYLSGMGGQGSTDGWAYNSEPSVHSARRPSDDWPNKLNMEIVRLVRKGVYLKVISEAGGFSSIGETRNFLHYYHLHGVWRRARYKVYRSERADRLARSGLKLGVIAKLSGWKDRRYAYEYYKRTDQLEKWQKSRPSYLGNVSLLIGAVGNDIANIVRMVQSRAYNNASDDERRAFDYLQFVIESDHNWAGPLNRYFMAREKKEATKCTDLCEGLGSSPEGLRILLGVLGLKPLGRPGRVPMEKKQGIEHLAKDRGGE